MATGGKVPSGRDRASREARERARLYQARAALHAFQKRRRVRDNLIAGIVGGLLLVGIIGGQVAYHTVGPGAPSPSPTGTPSPTPTATVPVSPSPAATPSPTTTP